MNIRIGEIKDVDKMLKMMLALDKETEYMLYEDGERPRDSSGLKETINRTIQNGSLLLLAEEGEEIIGFLSADRGQYNRIRHTAYVVVGIRKAYRGIGIGSKFFYELDLWAIKNRVLRLELTVMCPNTIAKHLYEKNGFKVEGIKEKSCYVNGQYVDEYYMAKIY